MTSNIYLLPNQHWSHPMMTPLRLQILHQLTISGLVVPTMQLLNHPLRPVQCFLPWPCSLVQVYFSPHHLDMHLRTASVIQAHLQLFTQWRASSLKKLMVRSLSEMLCFVAPPMPKFHAGNPTFAIHASSVSTMPQYLQLPMFPWPLLPPPITSCGLCTILVCASTNQPGSA